MCIKTTFYTFFGIPIVLHSFYKSVYNFGPKHYRKRGLWEIITEPVPTNFLETLQHKNQLFGSVRQQPSPIKRKLLQKGWDGFARTPIIPLSEIYCIYSSYYSPRAGSVGAAPMKASQEMRLTIHVAIHVFSPQIFFFFSTQTSS